jgi:class 3 adenylate cyclase
MSSGSAVGLVRSPRPTWSFPGNMDPLVRDVAAATVRSLRITWIDITTVTAPATASTFFTSAEVSGRGRFLCGYWTPHEMGASLAGQTSSAHTEGRMATTTRYAKSGDVHIAYRTIGSGPVDVVVAEQWFSNVEIEREVRPLARFNDRLSAFARVIRFDKRGVGLSDPVPATALPTLEEWMDDLRAVLDDIGSEKAAIVTAMAGGFMACVFAATYPDRVRALVLIDGFARLTRADDYPWGLTADQARDIIEAFESAWGTGMMLDLFDPDDADDVALRESWGRYERHSVSPGTAASMVDMINATDIRGILPAIRVPTLVVARADTPVESAHGRYLAERIAGATYVELPGRGSLLWSGDQDALLREIEHFVTGSRPAPRHDRVLATVLFTDIVGSTDRAAEIGDARWRELLAEHDQLVRRALDRFEGREVKTTGDGFLATFDGPARAIRCAEAIHEFLRPIGVDVRTGLHTGEIDLVDGDVGGIAVHLGARVMAEADAGETVVSSTVKDLVVGSGIAFEDRGEHHLKGVPGTWRLFAVSRSV